MKRPPISVLAPLDMKLHHLQKAVPRIKEQHPPFLSFLHFASKKLILLSASLERATVLNSIRFFHSIHSVVPRSPQTQPPSYTGCSPFNPNFLPSLPQSSSPQPSKLPPLARESAQYFLSPAPRPFSCPHLAFQAISAGVRKDTRNRDESRKHFSFIHAHIAFIFISISPGFLKSKHRRWGGSLLAPSRSLASA